LSKTVLDGFLHLCYADSDGVGVGADAGGLLHPGIATTDAAGRTPASGFLNPDTVPPPAVLGAAPTPSPALFIQSFQHEVVPPPRAAPSAARLTSFGRMG